MSAESERVARRGKIEVLARELRLPTVRRRYAQLAEEVARQGGDYEHYLHALLAEEATERHTRRIARRIKEARFGQPKLLSDLDWSAEPLPEQAQLMRLAECDYIEQGTNVIALGNPGTGKTHVAIGLGMAACHRNYRVRFYSAATLAAELQAASEEHQLHRYLARFGRWDLVILDELGYVPLGRTGAELLFQAVSERNERVSTIITSNLPFGEWTEVFGTERLTVAMLDRTTYRAIILQMNGPSYRLTHALEAIHTEPTDPPSTDQDDHGGNIPDSTRT